MTNCLPTEKLSPPLHLVSYNFVRNSSTLKQEIKYFKYFVGITNLVLKHVTALIYFRWHIDYTDFDQYFDLLQ